jgi:hypothetical protein
VKKSEVETYGGYPSVNVKVHQFGPMVGEIEKRFDCSEAQAEKALEYAWESAQESFWENWQSLSEVDPPDTYFFSGHRIKIYGEGRSSGHLVVHGLPDVESWDAIMLAKWAKFEKEVRSDIDYRRSPEAVFEDIEANRWFEDGAEQYNFLDVNGKTFSVPEIKAAEKAGRESLFASR